MFGKIELRTGRYGARKYCVNPNEEEGRNTMIQSKKIKHNTLNLNR